MIKPMFTLILSLLYLHACSQAEPSETYKKSQNATTSKTQNEQGLESGNQNSQDVTTTNNRKTAGTTVSTNSSSRNNPGPMSTVEQSNNAPSGITLLDPCNSGPTEYLQDNLIDAYSEICATGALDEVQEISLQNASASSPEAVTMIDLIPARSVDGLANIIVASSMRIPNLRIAEAESMFVASNMNAFNDSIGETTLGRTSGVIGEHACDPGFSVYGKRFRQKSNVDAGLIGTVNLDYTTGKCLYKVENSLLISSNHLITVDAVDTRTKDYKQISLFIPVIDANGTFQGIDIVLVVEASGDASGFTNIFTDRIKEQFASSVFELKAKYEN